MARIQINLDKEQLNAVRSLKGFGKKDAAILKNIVISFLIEKNKIG